MLAIAGFLDLSRVAAGLDGVDLLNASGVAASFERGVQPGADDAPDDPVPKHVCGNAEHVGIVVAAAHVRADFVL